jgi:hypothetical protein
MQNLVEQPARADNVGIRLPTGMKERMRAVAAADKRTLTSWIEKVLSDALEANEKRRKH